MTAITRLLFPLIGYVCVATVITMAGAYGYLRHTKMLDDERMFRIAALLHGVDLQEIAAAKDAASETVPPEEQSFEERQKQRQIAALIQQGKEDYVNQQLTEFKSRFKQLDVATQRYKTLKDEVEIFLNEQTDIVLGEGLAAVRRDLEMLVAKKQAKPLIGHAEGSRIA